jgi:chromatin remodeling complex protein RSC6
MATPITLETLSKELKALHKDVRKIRARLEDPTGEKSAARALNNGFKKLQDVTPELSAFLGLAAGEKIARADVTKRMSEYVKSKGLSVGQTITPDEPLKKLLNPPEGIKMTFLNIQKYISPHYIKEVAAVAVAGAAEPVKKASARPKVAKS